VAYLKRFLFRLRNFVQPGRAEQDLAREVESHLDLLQDDFRRRGMRTNEARLAAKRAFGGIEQAKELHREERSWLWLEQVRQDLRHSVRMLVNSPGFSLTAIVTLALGIGANTAIFSLINAVLLKTLPVSHPEQLVQVNMAGRDIWDMDEPFVSNPVWEQLRDRQDIFSGLFGYAVARFDLSARGEAHYVQGNYVSGQFFDTLGLRPIVGRLMTAADDRRSCPGITVLSYGFWRSEYGGRATVAGTTISLDNHPFEILGVIGSEFTGVDVGRQSDIYLPLCAAPIIGGEKGLLVDGWLQVIGRPRPGISVAQIESRLKTLARPISEATMPPNIQPGQQENYLKRTFAVDMASTGLSSIRSKYRDALVVLMMIVAAVLLVACSNVANLLLARGAARQREVAIRVALGSGRGRLMRQQLCESLLLSLTGAGFGILFAHWGAHLLVRLLVSNVYRENKVFLDLSIDARVLGFTVGVAVLTGLLSGLVPSWRATRVDPHMAMRANSRGMLQGRKVAFGKALVVFQVVISLVLVAGAGLLLSTFIRLQTMDPGFERAHVLLMDVDLGKRTTLPAQRAEIFKQTLEHLRALPGVRSASRSDGTPLGGAVGASYLQIDGEASPVAERELAFFNEVTSGYFETLGTRLLAGRDFTTHDTVSSPTVALVNESFARKYFHGQNPTGRRYRSEDGNKLGDPVEIIGMVRDVKYLDLREDFRPTVYVAADQNASPGKEVTFELRVASNPAAMVKAASLAVNTVDPLVSIQFRTLGAQVDESLARERLLATLSGFFGGLALLLAMIGLYGVTSYNVTQQRNEIGIRMALGAQRSRVLRTVLGEVMILIGIGLVIGLPATVAATHFIASLLYGVRANDPWTISVTATILALAAAIAGFLPARRASLIDPMSALREE
jgi:putative ABC transport system permease protein